MRRRELLAAGGTAGLAALAGCGVDDGDRGQRAADSLTLSSTAVRPGRPIPTAYTCAGADESPPLTVGDVPDAAARLALLVDDLDAPSGRFTHWVAWDLPPRLTELPRGVAPTAEPPALEGGVQGRNDFDEQGYAGPCPPVADEPHTYRFQVFALSEPVGLPPSAGGARLLGALDPRLVATGGFTATFDRS